MVDVARAVERATGSRDLPVVRSDDTPERPRVPWALNVMVLASASMALGLLWDLSWHRSIGRDAFWSPPHVPIYLGALAAGLTSAWLIARATLDRAGPPAAVAPVGRVRGPIGAWLGVWGAVAMLTAAPFDDWWHDAYGLDVEILSPPHVLLVLGIVAIQVGAVLLVVAWRNRRAGTTLAHRLLPGYAASTVLMMIVFLLLESLYPTQMHRAAFYEISAVAFPWILVAVARADDGAWGATTAAALYAVVSAVMLWILPLFPATPRFVPVHHPVTFMVPHPFPLLLPIPALAVDALARRWKGNDWIMAAALGVAFVLTFTPAQWWFAEFLLSPAARNWIFAGDAWSFYTPGDRRFEFWSTATDPVSMLSLGGAGVLAAASARAGLWLGAWMRAVRR
jgi:hypothetical protein